MKFTRTERYGKVTLSQRKITMMLSKPLRESKRLAEKLPLFADQLPAPQAVDVTAETMARQTHLHACEERMRALNARVWRESRRDFFAATSTERAEIRRAWANWTGPTTCLYFRYIVDLHTGVMQQRAETLRAQKQEIQDARRAHALTNPTLF